MSKLPCKHGNLIHFHFIEIHLHQRVNTSKEYIFENLINNPLLKKNSKLNIEKSLMTNIKKMFLRFLYLCYTKIVLSILAQIHQIIYSFL